MSVTSSRAGPPLAHHVADVTADVVAADQQIVAEAR